MILNLEGRYRERGGGERERERGKKIYRKRTDKTGRQRESGRGLLLRFR